MGAFAQTKKGMSCSLSKRAQRHSTRAHRLTSSTSLKIIRKVNSTLLSVGMDSIAHLTQIYLGCFMHCTLNLLGRPSPGAWALAARAPVATYVL